jgi:hypothetical protein
MLVMYTHPCRLVTAAFPDNFRGGRNTPRALWQPAPLRPRAQIEELTRDFDQFLRWVVEEGAVVPMTYRTLIARYQQPTLPWLSRAGLLELCRRVEGRLDAQTLEGLILSPAEQCGVLLRAASYYTEHGTLPAEVPVRPLLGPESPPPVAVAAAQGPHALSVEGLGAALRQADEEAAVSGMVPSTIHANGGLSPATALRAAAAYLLAAEAGGEAARETLTIPPCDQEPLLSGRPDIGDYSFGNWSILPPGFRGDGVRAMARLQAWTAKPAS